MQKIPTPLFRNFHNFHSTMRTQSVAIQRQLHPHLALVSHSFWFFCAGTFLDALTLEKNELGAPIIKSSRFLTVRAALECF